MMVYLMYSRPLPPPWRCPVRRGRRRGHRTRLATATPTPPIDLTANKTGVRHDGQHQRDGGRVAADGAVGHPFVRVSVADADALCPRLGVVFNARPPRCTSAFGGDDHDLGAINVIWCSGSFSGIPRGRVRARGAALVDMTQTMFALNLIDSGQGWTGDADGAMRPSPRRGGREGRAGSR